MTEPKFTPGPWNYKDTEIISTHEKRGRPVSVVDLFGAMGGEDSDADAYLMAAAPELYEALADAEFIMRKAGQIKGPMQDSFNRSASDARKALDKARGEAND